MQGNYTRSKQSVAGVNGGFSRPLRCFAGDGFAAKKITRICLTGEASNS